MPFTCRNHACITGVFPYTCDSHVKRMITCVYHAYHTFCKIFNTGTMPFVCRNHACITGVFPYTCETHDHMCISCVSHSFFTHVSHAWHETSLSHACDTHVKRMCHACSHVWHFYQCMGYRKQL